MNVSVKYFGAIAEVTGTTEETLDLGEIGNQVKKLKDFCESKYEIENLSYQLSVNKKLTEEGELKDGDEIAFLPPFAGG